MNGPNISTSPSTTTTTTTQTAGGANGKPNDISQASWDAAGKSAQAVMANFGKNGQLDSSAQHQFAQASAANGDVMSGVAVARGQNVDQRTLQAAIAREMDRGRGQVTTTNPSGATGASKPETSGGAQAADSADVTSGKAALPSPEAQARAKANAAKAIEMFDADKDGSIDMGELDTWVKAAGKGNADESAKFTNANKDSVLSQQEIEDAYNKQYAGEEANAAKAQAQAEDGARQAKADKAAEEAIKYADKSGDGKLDASEIDDWAKQANFDADKAKANWNKNSDLAVDKAELAARFKAQYDQEAGIKPEGGEAKAEPSGGSTQPQPSGGSTQPQPSGGATQPQSSGGSGGSGGTEASGGSGGSGGTGASGGSTQSQPTGSAAHTEPAARQETVDKLEKGKAELESAAAEKKLKEEADTYADQAIKKLDTSGDKAVDHDEIVDAYAKEGLPKEKAEKDFAHHNQNGDLKLTKEEIAETYVQDEKKAAEEQKKPEPPPEGGAKQPEGPPKPTPEQVKAEEARKAAEELKAAQAAEAAKAEQEKRDAEAAKERDVAHWSNAILNQSTSKENMGIYGANIAKTMPHALKPEHVSNMDDNGVREMMGRMSDGDLAKVPAATRQAMVDQLDAGWTSGEEYQMMSRLKTSMAMHP